MPCIIAVYSGDIKAINSIGKKMTKYPPFLIFFFYCASFIALADELPWGKWRASKNANFEIDNKRTFKKSPSLLLSRKEQKNFSIETEAFNLEPNSAYILGVNFMPDEAFIKGYGKIYIVLKCGDNISRASWQGPLCVNGWNYLSLRFDAASLTKAEIKMIFKGPGSIRLGQAKLDKIFPPDKGLDLSCQYMQIPFGTRSENRIFDHLDVKEGTIEFWLRPHWDALNNRRFKSPDVRPFFFWGRQQYENSISIYSWNKFPNIYFALCGKNHKQGTSVFYYDTPERGWRKNIWHHIAACWKRDEENTRMTLFVDGMPCVEKIAKTVIVKYLKRDMFLGAGKRHNQLKIENTAAVDMAMLRISKGQKYAAPFIPGKYKIENDTLCFFPFDNDEDYVGFFLNDGGKMKKFKAKIFKIGNFGKDDK